MSNFTADSIDRLHQMVETIRKYLGYKTLVCLMSSGFITFWLLATKQSYAIPLGMLAFLLNYVPSIGSIIAAIPAVLIALIEKGVGSAALCSLGYLIANLVIESIIEPRLLGRSLGLSPAFILINMVFWGWMLGPVGMLLSVPLTMMVKIFLQSHPQTEWLSILMGSSPGRKPVEKITEEKPPVDG
jgi:predicted PurR-regulated permease PerM